MSVSRVVLMASFVACAQSQLQPSVRMMMPGRTTGTGVSAQVSQAVTLSANTFLNPGSNLWRDEFNDNARISDFLTDHYVNALAAIPLQATVPAGAQGVFDCPPGQTCDLYVFLYECHPCEVVHNVFPRDLVSMGFTRTRCGPLFSLYPGGPMHKMTAFVKRIDGDTSETITLPEDVRYMIAGIVGGFRQSVNCPGFTTVDQCLDDGNLNFCKFSSGGCDYNSCQAIGVNLPSGKGCEVCAPLN